MSQAPVLRRSAPRAGSSVIAVITLLITAVGAAYHNSFDGPFVFDDLPAIQDNPTIRSPWPPATVLSPPAASGVGGRPLANLSFALNRAIGGEAAASFHAGNLLLHAGSTLLLFGVLRRTLTASSPWLAGAIALLWSVHPLTTAAVTWLSQRTELLMAFCYLLTLYAFIRGTAARCPGWMGLSVAACLLGMMSKEVMVTAPVAVLLYDRTFVAGGFRAAWAQRRGYYFALASTWLVLGYLLTTGLSLRSVGFGLGVSPLRYALTEGQAILHYLQLSIWPAPLVFDYGAVYATASFAIAASALGVLGLLGATGWMLRHRPAAGFLAGAVFLLLAPTSSFVPVAEQPIAENRMYLPLAAIVTGVALAFHGVARHRARKLLPTVAAALCILTLSRNVDYRSALSLWTDTTEKRPQNPRAHFNRGLALLTAGQAAEAIPAFERALALKPADAKAHHSLGHALLEFGRVDEALARFAEAVRLEPGYAGAWHSSGTALLRRGDASGAMAHFERAIRLQPDLAAAHQGLGNACFQLNRPAEAIAHYATALRHDPNLADAHYNAGSACLELGRHADAVTHFTAAARLKPGDAEIRNNLGAALLRAGRAAEAIAAFEHALRLKPDYADARDNLAVARGASLAPK